MTYSLGHKTGMTTEKVGRRKIRRPSYQSQVLFLERPETGTTTVSVTCNACMGSILVTLHSPKAVRAERIRRFVIGFLTVLATLGIALVIQINMPQGYQWIELVVLAVGGEISLQILQKVYWPDSRLATKTNDPNHDVL